MYESTKPAGGVSTFRMYFLPDPVSDLSNMNYEGKYFVEKIRPSYRPLFVTRFLLCGVRKGEESFGWNILFFSDC